MDIDQKKAILNAVADIANRFKKYIVLSFPDNYHRRVAIERLYECILWLRESIEYEDK